MKRLLVTGAAGFIGSNFVRYILGKYPDYRITVLDALTYAGNLDNFHDIKDNPNFQFFKGNIEDPVIVDNLSRNVDAILNFAAESHVDRSIDNPGAFIETDVRGVFVLLEAAKKYGHERFLHVSTDEVYGSIDDGSFKEGDPLEPNSPYSASKAGGELLVRAYNVTYGVPTIVTRGSNNFGPYHYPEKLIPLMITNAIDDLPLPVYGDGKQVRDWMYVLDHCAGIDIAFHKGLDGEIYNVGGGNERYNIDVVQGILTHLGKGQDLIRYVQDRPGHDRRYSIDCAKLKALGYEPEKSFEDRLEETVRWYVENEAWWRKIKEKQDDYKKFAERWYADRK
jgi:dTDP-glucose 4,6-dehydratase